MENNSEESLVKLMNLMKSWSCAPTGHNADESRQQILHKLAYCQNASKKSQDELKVLRIEAINDQKAYKAIARKISNIKKQINTRKIEYMKAKMYRKQVMKVNLISDIVRDYPSCIIMKRHIKILEDEVEQLEDKHKLLTRKFSSIEKQVKIMESLASVTHDLMENLTSLTNELMLEPECD